MAEFAINNAVHASTGHTLFFVNAKRHPRLPSTLGAVASSLGGGGSTVALEQPQTTADTDLSTAMTRARARARTRQGDVSVPGTDTVKNNEPHTCFVKGQRVCAGPDTSKPHAQTGSAAITHEVSVPGTDTTKSHAQSGTDANTSGGAGHVDKVNELDPGFTFQAMDSVQKRQAVKLNADNVGRGNTNEFKVGSLVLLSTQNLRTHAVSGFGASLLAPLFIGPLTVGERHGSAYALELPSDMRLHPTFYVGA
ncbi:LOW QUALITY PROTEIN: hypothetical protein PHMEG_00033724, partial [Phytophthora megakarya]